MTEPTLKLPRGADELLLDFPVTEPDFDAMTRAIEARLASAPDALQDNLLQAPELAPEVGEPDLPSTVRAGTPAKGGLAELARKSLQKKAEDDGAALAKELLAATSQPRRPDAEMVARVRAAGKAATSTPLPEERTSGVIARAVAPSPPASLELPPSRAKRGVFLGALGGALAVAAAVALFLRAGGPQRSPTDAALTSPQRPEPVAAAPAKESPPSPVAAPAQALAPSDAVVTPEGLAVAPALKRDDAAASAKVAATDAAAARASKPASAAAAGKRESVTLDDAMQRAAASARAAEPAPEPAMKPAEGNTDSVPLSPSGGAVSTALGAVRGGAQACLAGQTEAVVAVITFASDGHVTNVTAGGPSGACIQAALAKARLAPFAKERFSATTTIRPP